jgi:hypothetical protein
MNFGIKSSVNKHVIGIIDTSSCKRQVRSTSGISFGELRQYEKIAFSADRCLDIVKK